jgi:RNA polymerase sigma-70 factor (ECF subfamily)
MDRDTELALVAGLRRREVAAFDAVYDAYRSRLFNFLARLCRRRDVAEDLLEETWLRVVAKARDLRPDTRLAPWLFTVARNLYWSYCRSRLLEDRLEAAVASLWPAGGYQASPFEEAAASELDRRVERALAGMPPRYREVLMLVGIEGLTPAEAAVVCGITPEALRQRLSRARVMLSDQVDAARHDGPPAVCAAAARLDDPGGVDPC